MRRKVTLLAALAAAFLLPAMAGAEEAKCIDATMPKAQIAAKNGKWTELTHEQWLFLSGVYALAPSTPPGLPFGDKAVLVQIPGDTGALVFFEDGSKVCTPLPIPKELLEMLWDVGLGVISHEGDGL
jgi:hypothetical protein